MTPKEKAEDLFDDFYWEFENDYKAKKCALIVVEEILDDDMFDMSEELFVKRIEYWEQVKEEIQKL